MKDINLQVVRALPGVDGTVTSSDIDLEAVSAGSRAGSSVRNAELVVEMPAFTVGELANGATLTMTVQTGDAAAPTTSANLVKVITGAGGVGAAAQDVKFRLPSTVGRYVNVKFVGAGGTGSMVAKNATISLRPRLY